MIIYTYVYPSDRSPRFRAVWNVYVRIYIIYMYMYIPRTWPTALVLSWFFMCACKWVFINMCTPRNGSPALILSVMYVRVQIWYIYMYIPSNPWPAWVLSGIFMFVYMWLYVYMHILRYWPLVGIVLYIYVRIYILPRTHTLVICMQRIYHPLWYCLVFFSVYMYDCIQYAYMHIYVCV